MRVTNAPGDWSETLAVGPLPDAITARRWAAALEQWLPQTGEGQSLLDHASLGVVNYPEHASRTGAYNAAAGLPTVAGSSLLPYDASWLKDNREQPTCEVACRGSLEQCAAAAEERGLFMDRRVAPIINKDHGEWVETLSDGKTYLQRERCWDRQAGRFSLGEGWIFFLVSGGAGQTAARPAPVAPSQTDAVSPVMPRWADFWAIRKARGPVLAVLPGRHTGSEAFAWVRSEVVKSAVVHERLPFGRRGPAGFVVQGEGVLVPVKWWVVSAPGESGALFTAAFRERQAAESFHKLYLTASARFQVREAGASAGGQGRRKKR
jgi:hypothetical protein